MCNPRRIRVRASRQLAEAWRAEVTRTVEATGTAVGEARLTQQLGRSLPAPVRDRLLQLLRADSSWRAVGDTLRHDMPGGYLTYHPATGVVEIVAQVSTDFSVEASATRVHEGVGRGSHESEVEVEYYTDGYRGRTRGVAEREGQQLAGTDAEKHAREQATRAAAADKAAAVRRLHEESDAIDAEARTRALALVEEERRRREIEAQGQAELLAQTRQQDYLREINLPLAHAYRDILLAHATRANAANLYVREDGDIIDIQFEQREA